VNTSTSPHHLVCVRTQPNFVDDAVKSVGYNTDCQPLPSLASGPGVFVDIGANIGSCTLLMAAHGHRTYAFEPLDANFRLLQASLQLNGFQNHQIFHAGVSRESLEDGMVIYERVGNAGASEVLPSGFHTRNISYFANRPTAGSQPIQTVALDDAVHEYVDVMKIDCQGCELGAMQGATKLLGAGMIGVLKIEFYPLRIRMLEGDPAEMLVILLNNGYEVRELPTNWNGGASEEGSLIAPDNVTDFVRRVSGSALFVDIIARYKGR